MWTKWLRNEGILRRSGHPTRCFVEVLILKAIETLRFDGPL
jgi:hypothetical protein